MAVGFIFAKNTCTWGEIHNPSFVFTSPNMDQGVAAGTRSHVVPEEIDIALWLEDSDANKMYRWMIDQNTIEYCNSGSYGNFVTINYDNYKIDRYTLSSNVESPCDVIHINTPTSFVLPKFYMYDTFSGIAVDSSKWNETASTNGSISVSDGTLKLSIGSVTTGEYTYCSSVESYSGNYVLEVGIKADLVNTSVVTDGVDVRVTYTSSSGIYVKICKSSINIGVTGGSFTTYTKFSDTITVRLVRSDDVLYIYVAQGNSAFRLYTTYNNVTVTSTVVTMGLYASVTSSYIYGYFDNIIISDRLDVFLPNTSTYDNRFYAVAHSPAVTNWFKLNDNPPLYIDSIDSMYLTSSGVSREYDSSVGDYVAAFSGNSIIVSSGVVTLGDEFSVSLFVDDYGDTCGSEAEFFDECQTFINLYAYDGSYFSIGTTDTNTLYYKVHTSVSTFFSDTGITMVSGTLEHIGITCSSGTGIKFYHNGTNVSSISSAIGTVGSGILSIGNINQGVGSKFRGRVSDVKIVSSGILTEQDNKTLYDNGPITGLDYSIYGFSVGNISLGVSDYIFKDYPEFKDDLYLSNSLHIIMKFGEAYNCYLTAWDDNTHSTTSNSVFTNQVIKLSAAVFRAKPDSGGYPSSYVGSVDDTYIVYSSASDIPIKGNDYYFGKFNLVYYIGDSAYIGDVLSFRPRLSEVTKSIFPPGNYDFVITFHYQYT
jgi:hypothetical protein